jgi:hypothetical protein
MSQRLRGVRSRLRHPPSSPSPFRIRPKITAAGSIPIYIRPPEIRSSVANGLAVIASLRGAGLVTQAPSRRVLLLDAIRARIGKGSFRRMCESNIQPYSKRSAPKILSCAIFLVIVVSGNDKSDLPFEGVAAYLKKPINPDRLIEIIDRHPFRVVRTN